jgi:putative hydrolase of HD superfamily
MSKKLSTEHQSIVSLGKLILKFARTDRATYHEDGITPESDTDHTIMLAVIACACAEKFAPRLNRGKIAELALVHDLVEVYAKDTPTLKPLDKKSAQDKKLREEKAFKKMEGRFGTIFPWVTQTIHEYESLTSPEARFIKAIDKIMPKITSVLNKGATEKKAGFSESTELEKMYANQQKQIAEWISDYPEIVDIYEALADESLTPFRKTIKKSRTEK